MNDFKDNGRGILVPARYLHRDGLKSGGVFLVEHIRNGKVIDREETHNLVVLQGLDHILSVEFTQAAQVQAWFLGLFSGNYTPVPSDTAATFPGNATECTFYTSSTRVPFTAVEGSQSVTNSASPSVFTFNATATIYGGFLSSVNGKSATSGFLFSALQFAAPKNVVSTDQLSLTYTLSASSS